MSLNQTLDALSETLQLERQALLHADMQALVSAAERKIELLQLAASFPAEIPQAEARLKELAESNLANGSLLARRRMDLSWMLRQLGASTRDTAYDAQGIIPERAIARLQAEA
ncbi:MAG: FlgN protein [Alphaproteobacteria bacterium ADurb.BinA280]|jgi:flagellar biosynthesis/type III secretory pathway chaperone|nr:flagellar protein FlgN [Xanthomonadales bacterium]MCC6504622.1 flagellar protein FlgN [Aquimonas sp.]OPZ12916.1 MAG: FlgN protein [Alphaproteobacteria bacterium ADurb.BinA280]